MSNWLAPPLTDWDSPGGTQGPDFVAFYLVTPHGRYVIVNLLGDDHGWPVVRDTLVLPYNEWREVEDEAPQAAEARIDEIRRKQQREPQEGGDDEK